MMLRSWTRAVHFPNELVGDVLAQGYGDDDLATMTEVLGCLRNTQVAFWVIRNQLENTRPLVREAAMVALRVIFVRAPDTLFPLLIHDRLLEMLVYDDCQTIRLLVADALADFTLEKRDLTE
jgi:hypothetical protein